jgi:aryl-alcohol dehydrogenase-like predicted oxidoreductase
MAMKYRLFGNTGLRVSELCLGTMTFGEDWGWGSNLEESRRIFDAFVEAGGNFIDTADLYTDGTAERMVGEFIKDHRERFVVATKFTLNTDPANVNGGGNHRKRIHEAVNQSLQRLGTDYIDLYWMHAWDGVTPVEETMRALDDLVRAGKVLYVGVSDTPAWVVSRANMLAELRGWSAFAGLQVEYSLIERTVERELLPMAHGLGMAVTAWSPLAGGLLTGKYNGKSSGEETKRLEVSPFVELSDRNLKIAAEVSRVASELEVSASQVALAWVRSRVANVLPILGARKVSQFLDNLGCLRVELPEAAIKRLDDASQIQLGFPHSFLEKDMIRETIFGEKLGSLEVARHPDWRSSRLKLR